MIKVEKWDKLSLKSKEIIDLLEQNLKGKLNDYMNEFEKWEWRMTIFDLLWDINVNELGDSCLRDINYLEYIDNSTIKLIRKKAEDIVKEIPKKVHRRGFSLPWGFWRLSTPKVIPVPEPEVVPEPENLPKHDNFDLKKKDIEVKLKFAKPFNRKLDFSIEWLFEEEKPNWDKPFKWILLKENFNALKLHDIKIPLNANGDVIVKWILNTKNFSRNTITFLWKFDVSANQMFSSWMKLSALSTQSVRVIINKKWLRLTWKMDVSAWKKSWKCLNMNRCMSLNWIRCLFFR